jgi:hypothetical protein
MILAGQAICGGVVSLTVTVKLQLLVLPDESATVQLTVVTPLVKLVPEAGEQTAVPTFGQLSVTCGVA